MFCKYGKSHDVSTYLYISTFCGAGERLAEGKAKRCPAAAAQHQTAGAQADRQLHVRLSRLQLLAVLCQALGRPCHQQGQRDSPADKRPHSKDESRGKVYVIKISFPLPCPKG